MGGQNEEDKPSDSSSLPKEKAAIPPSELALVGLGQILKVLQSQTQITGF